MDETFDSGIGAAPLAPAAAPLTFDELAAPPAAFSARTPFTAPPPAPPIADAPVQGVALPMPAAPPADAEPDYEAVVRRVQSGDPKQRPLKDEYDRAYDAQPEDGPRAQRAWLLRHGLNPDDKSEAAQARAKRWLGYNKDIAAAGYTEEQLARIAVEDEDKPEARRALFETLKAKVVGDIDQRFAAMRDQVASRLQSDVDNERDALAAQQQRAVQDQFTRGMQAIEVQRRNALSAEAEAQRQNRLNSFVNPISGKVEYLPGYNPREAARPDQTNLRFDQQVERLRAQFDQQMSRFDTRQSETAVRQLEGRNRDVLRQFDREAGAQKAAQVRQQVAELNAFLAARLDDARPDIADGAILPYKDQAEIEREKRKKTEGSFAGVVGDVALDLAKGATLGPASGLAQVLTWGSDKVGLTREALPAVQRYVDSAEAAVEGLRSDAGRAQRDQQAEAIAKAIEGKTGVEALVAGAKAGATSFGLDRNTFGQIANMAGALLLGGAVGAGTKAVAAGAESAAAVSALAEGGAVAASQAGRLAAGLGTPAGRGSAAAAFAGQSADSASREAATDAAALIKDPQFRAASPLLADLRQKFPTYSDQQIDDLAVRQIRGAAAAGGAAATALTMVVPGLGGIEAQLLRIGAPMGAGVPGALGSAARIVGRAAGEGIQEVAEDLGSALAAATAAGDARLAGAFTNAGKMGASFGAGAALGGVVGNAHAALDRIRGRSAEQALRDGVPPVDTGTGPTVPQTVDALALPTPAQVQRADLVARAEGTAVPADSSVVYAPSPQAAARIEAARIAGEDAAKVPEIERVLSDIGRNVDATAGASVATMVGEYATAYGVDIPEGSVVHFANNAAHYAWAADLVQGKEATVVFSTPPGPGGVAITRAVTPDGTNVMTAHDYSGGSVVIGDEAAADADLHVYGASVLAGLNQLGADIRTGAKESLVADSFMLSAAEAVRTNSIEDYRRDNGSYDPAVAAVSAVRSLQRVSGIYDGLSDGVRTPLDSLLRAAFPDQPAGNPAQYFVQDPELAAARLNEAFAAGALKGEAARTASRAYNAALKMAEAAHEAAHEARLAEAYRSGEEVLPQEIIPTARRRAALSSIISQPALQVPVAALPASLNAVPNTGRFKPGSVAAPNASPQTDESRTAYAVFQLAADMAARPSMSVAAARNLAVHYSAGRADTTEVVRAAVQMAKENIATAEAAKAEAARISADYARWEGEGGRVQDFPYLAPKAATPVSRAVLEQLAKFMARRFEGTKLQIAVIETDSDPRAGGNRGFAGLTRSVDGDVLVLLNRERIGSVEQARAVINHEVYSHFVPMEVLDRQKFAAVNAAVLGFARKDATTEAFLRRFTADYQSAMGRVPSPYQQGAEVLSYLIEQKRQDAAALDKRVADALRGSSFAAGDLTPADLKALLGAMAAVADGRISIAQARVQTDILNVYYGEGTALRRQRVTPPARSAFSLDRSRWVGFRERLNSRYYLSSVADILKSLTSNDAANRLADKFKYELTGVRARAASLWQRTYEQRWIEINGAIARAARESGVGFETMQARLDELLLARHAIDRNLWGMRLSAPLPVGEAKARRKVYVDRWRRGEISREDLAANLDQLLTEDNLRLGMQQRIEGEGGAFDPAVHKYRADDALYAGADMTPRLARAALDRLGRDAVLARLDKEVAPSLQRIRDAMLAQRQATGYDPHNKGSLFRETYVPITPSGESTGRGAGGYERVNLEFNTSTASMQGLGENTASRQQLATMKGMTHAAADEGTNQALMLDFLDILKQLEALDPELVRSLRPGEKMQGGLAQLATVQNIGRHEQGSDPDKSGRDRTIVVRDKDGRFGGQKGDFYEILINDEKLAAELALNKNTEDSGFGRTMKFINRTVQSSFIQYNPAGIARNAVYDVQQATMSGVKYGVGRKVAADIGRLYMGLLSPQPDSIGRYFRSYFLGGPDEKAAFMARQFAPGSDGASLQEFVRSGAHMVFSSLNTLPGETVGTRELVETLAGKAEVSSNATARAAGEALERWKQGTELIENIARFALFRALRGDGREPGSKTRGFTTERAAHEATKLVLDYHQTSSTARFMSSWFFFANPSLVDLETNLTNRIWKNGRPPTERVKTATGYKEVFRDGWVSEIDPRYVGVRVGLILGQVLLLGAMLSDDEWKKLKLSDITDKWLIPGVLVGEPGQLVKVSKNYGIDRIIDGMIAAPALMYFGHPKGDDLARDAFNLLAKNLSAGVDIQMREDTPALLDLVRSATPSILQPAVDFASGVDRFGQKTAASAFYGRAPAYTASRFGTEPLFHDAAKFAYRQSNGTFDWTAEQLKQFSMDYSSMIPIASLFTNFAVAYGRQSAQAELNAATGRPELGPTARFLNSIGAPVQLRDSVYSPEAEWVRIDQDFILPLDRARKDAAQRDIEAGGARQRKTDSLDFSQMGPAERAVMQENPRAVALMRLQREVKKPLEEARKARDDARARGDGTTMFAAQVKYRTLAEDAVRRAKLLVEF